MTGSDILPVVAMPKLRLAGACALLGKDLPAPPQPLEDPTAYLQAIIDGLCELSLRDALTGCSNRRHFISVLERELDRVARSGDVALLLMVDVDHFKRINDEYGHQAGDMVLQQVAHCLAGCVRPMDTLARYGGEEFAIVLPACQTVYGRAVAERIRHTVEALKVRISPSQVIQVTVSIGGAYALQWIRSTRDLWIQRADQCLYTAKSDGRNRIAIEEQPDSTVTAEEKNLLFAPDSYSPSTTWSGDWPEALWAPADPADGIN